MRIRDAVHIHSLINVPHTRSVSEFKTERERSEDFETLNMYGLILNNKQPYS